MKKYILIQNDGEIETNSFELIGASTKRGETGKIGFFGSGLKYSIAYMMRNEIDFRVFSGEKELVFTTMPEQLKGQTFERICINGAPTSYTVTMGPTWTEDWFVLREIYCNAMDESNCQLIKETENINFANGKTRIYISLTEKLAKVIDNWDGYFSADREPLIIQDSVYTSYVGLGDIGGKNVQPITVFRKTQGVLFRRGINVKVKDNLIYDYQLEFVDINEDRTAKNSDGIGYATTDLVAQLCNDNYVKNVLRTGNDDKPCYEYSCLAGYVSSSHTFSSDWVRFSKENMLVVREIIGRFAEEIAKAKGEVFQIPSGFARKLKERQPEIIILGMGRSIGEVGMSDIDITPKMSFLLKQVMESLKEMKYEVPYEVNVVHFDNDTVLGQADINKKIIYLSAGLFDMGRREIAMTLMEETEHIISGKGDETRAFQTHIFSQWLKSMEDSNALFL